ncbi:MAG: MerR family transcriptional regulator [Candidatus Pristimantibacillus sp.]
MSREIAFSIKESSEQTGISEDTIRYYEKIGLLPRAERKENGHRVYRTEDIEMMKLINCLKKTGMSLDEMKPFLQLSKDDDLHAFPELFDTIQNHKAKIKGQIDSLQEILDFIELKLDKGFAEEQNCAVPKASKQNLMNPLTKLA